RLPDVMGTAWRVARVASCTRRLEKKGSRLTNRASGRSRTKVAKAALISGPVLALKTWICIPTSRAAGSRYLNIVSVEMALAGLESTQAKRSRLLGAGLDRPPRLEIGHIHFPPSGIQSQYSASRRNPPAAEPAEREPGERPLPGMLCQEARLP